ncbi:MAG TPA: glycosyltransferase family 4 protein [Roseiflexaceae bacterium]|nr:glycosyltransferase family 4 protein [Roseiflexaceae bacterium]
MASPQLTILLPTDVFPPRCGGAGWSAHALALALIERGHRVCAIVPRQGARGMRREEVLGAPALRYGYPAPNIPFVRNYFRHERLWHPLAGAIVTAWREGVSEGLALPDTPLIIHAQHVQVTPAAVLAGELLRAPVVVTVRDHWPWDYFATGLHGDRVPHPRQTWHSLAADLPVRLGPLRGSAALAAIPYLLAHLRRRQQFLRRAAAVIACSRYVARRLEAVVPRERVHVIPHLVDLPAIERTLAAPPASVAPGEPYLLFVGKLERNKGAHLLLDVFRALRDAERPTTSEEDRGQSPVVDRRSLVVAGDGPLRGELERGLHELGVRARFLAWAEHDEVLRLMAHCELLLFPSAWGEPLSRVLLEACACGAPILAMPTGGTPDIIEDGVSGALAATPGRFAERLAELLARPEERRALATGARRRARECFAKETVVGQVEDLYRSLL